MSEHEQWRYDQGPIGRLIKTGYITLRREVEELARPAGLTHTQWSALAVIRHFPGMMPSQLEPILMIERPSVTSLINGLERRGLIVRRPNPQDGRSKRIYLTEAGLKLAEDTAHFTAVVEQTVKDGLTPDEFAALKALLVKMIGLLQKEEQA